MSRGDGPELQNQNPCDYCNRSNDLWHLHSLSKNQVCEDCCGSRFSHADDAGMTGLDMTERLDIECIRAERRAQSQGNDQPPCLTWQAPELAKARRREQGEEQTTENQSV